MRLDLVALILQFLSREELLTLRTTCRFFELAVRNRSNLNIFVESYLACAFHKCYTTYINTDILQEVMDNYGDWLELTLRLMLFKDPKRLSKIVENWLPPCTNTFASIISIVINDLKLYSLVGYDNTDEWNLDDLLLDHFFKLEDCYSKV